MASYGRPPYGYRGRGRDDTGAQRTSRGRSTGRGDRRWEPQPGAGYGPASRSGPHGQRSDVRKTVAASSRSRGTRTGDSPSSKRAKLEGSLELSAATVARVAAIRESSGCHRTREEGGEESDEEEEESGVEASELVRKTLSMYYKNLGNGESKEGCVEELSGSLLQLASGSCLVCLSVIKRAEAVWSCVQCYCLFHLQCIQQWARDGVKQQTLLSPDLFPGQELAWSCPKCRRDYKQSDFPEKYNCFCGQQMDPPIDFWLLPHSCGEICDRPLQSECGHRCLSLCHPGPCPPCPKTANVTCYCGRSQPTVKRCGVRGWTCGRACGKVLSCGMHTCEARCHEGTCQPCDQVVEQWCLCGRESQSKPCAAPEWQCSQPCNKLLSCGNHHCEKVCHSGSCGDCPRSGARTCPCGKTRHTLPCTEDIPTCGDTCNKALLCGQHECMRPCHSGECGQCLQMAVKRCRCGRKEKSLPCSTEYLCEGKCSELRQCGRHQCRRKCCDGNCPSCEQVCGRTLGCRNHKCAAPCHGGRCYPCVLTVNISCNCGATKLTVPCGREKVTRPPKCREFCKNPPSCHHPEREPHLCHMGPCPPCRQLCGKPFSCGHTCFAKCHSQPQMPPRPPGVAPWVKMDNVKPIVKPCPACMQPVSKACKGEHEVSQFPCSEVREHCCGRRCGRKLACGNHSCKRGCHVIINPPDDLQAGDDCLQCEKECLKPRPRGCTHTCPLPCHQGDCPKCESLVKLRCHCATMNLFIKCCEWTAASADRKAEVQTCTSQCTKTLPCGHCCPMQCHPGGCLKPEECKRKITLRCPCRRIKKECRCFERQQKTPECDSECSRIQKEQEEEKRRELKARREQEEREEKEREEAVLRQMRPKRRRRRPRVEEEEEEEGFYQRHRTTIWAAGLVLACAVVMGGSLGTYLVLWDTS